MVSPIALSGYVSARVTGLGLRLTVSAFCRYLKTAVAALATYNSNVESEWGADYDVSQADSLSLPPFPTSSKSASASVSGSTPIAYCELIGPPKNPTCFDSIVEVRKKQRLRLRKTTAKKGVTAG